MEEKLRTCCFCEKKTDTAHHLTKLRDGKTYKQTFICCEPCWEKNKTDFDYNFCLVEALERK